MPHPLSHPSVTFSERLSQSPWSRNSHSPRSSSNTLGGGRARILPGSLLTSNFFTRRSLCSQYLLISSVTIFVLFCFVFLFSHQPRFSDHDVSPALHVSLEHLYFLQHHKRLVSTVNSHENLLFGSDLPLLRSMLLTVCSNLVGLFQNYVIQ